MNCLDIDKIFLIDRIKQSNIEFKDNIIVTINNYVLIKDKFDKKIKNFSIKNILKLIDLYKKINNRNLNYLFLISEQTILKEKNENIINFINGIKYILDKNDDIDIEFKKYLTEIVYIYNSYMYLNNKSYIYPSISNYKKIKINTKPYLNNYNIHYKCSNIFYKEYIYDIVVNINEINIYKSDKITNIYSFIYEEKQYYLIISKKYSPLNPSIYDIQNWIINDLQYINDIKNKILFCEGIDKGKQYLDIDTFIKNKSKETFLSQFR
jgi:hypothetical protein